jgi:hypothetical protein
VDLVPEPLLLRKSVSAGNLTRDLWICSQKLWPLDHRGGPRKRNFLTMKCDAYIVTSFVRPGLYLQ